ncbi:MAG TPA: PAS domain S-box protein [Armatimonadaceae bacterium]|nr:PAS domain S-box protein [Armatimonadaceae bacterium]
MGAGDLATHAAEGAAAAAVAATEATEEAAGATGDADQTAAAGRTRAQTDRRIRLAVDNALDFAIVTMDREGRFDTWSVGAERLLGYSEREAVGQHVSLIFTPEDRARGIPEAEMQTALRTGRSDDERLHVRKDGTRFFASGVLSAVRDEAGNFEGFAKILRDLTERQRTQELLRDSEERYRTLFDSIDEGYCVAEVLFEGARATDLRFFEVNALLRDRAGGDVPPGRTARELAPGLEQFWFDAFGRVALTGEPVRFQNRSEALGGRWFDVYAFRVGDPGGHRVAILFSDVTGRKNAEAEALALKAGLADDLAAISRLHALSTRLVMAAGGGGGGEAALGDVLDEVLDATIDLQGADLGNLQLYDRATGRLFVAAQRGFAREYLDRFTGGVPADEGSAEAAAAGAAIAAAKPSGRAIARRERVIVEDVEADPEYEPLRPLAAEAGYRAAQATPLFSRDGEPLGVLTTHFRRPHRPGERELTLTDLYARLAAELIERKRDEQALRDSEGRLRIALEATGLALWEWDIAADRVHWSREAHSVTGLFPGQTSEGIDALRRLVHPEDADAVARASEEAVRTGGTFQAEYRLVGPDGRVRWVSNHARVERDASGRPFRMIGTLENISERKNRERDAAFLAALSDTLQPLSDAATIQVEAARTLGQHLGVNRAVYAEVAPDGAAQVLAGGGHVEGVPPLDGPYPVGAVAPAVFSALRAGKTVVCPDTAAADADPPMNAEQVARTEAMAIRAHVTVPLVKDGALVALLSVNHATPREWTPGEVALAEEVTRRTRFAVERARAEEALRQSEARFAAIFAQAEVGISELSLDGRFLRVNDALCRILGRSAEDLLARTVADVTHPDDLAASLVCLRGPVETGVPASVDKRYVRGDGTAVWANSIVSRLDDEQGRPLTLLAATVDLTERKRAEEALRRANDILEERVAARTRALTERTEELARTNEVRQELLRQLVTAQEAERGRISRELHDELGQSMTALMLGLRSLSDDPALAAAASPSATETLDRLRDVTSDLAENAHRLSFALRPTALDDLGLVAALSNYLEEWRHWSGVPAELETVGFDPAAPGDSPVRLPPEVESTVYRVVQEALNNVLRHAVVGAAGSGHAGATCVGVLLHLLRGEHQAEIVATVEDDGPGFDAEAALRLSPENQRLGLFGMRERAALVGGTLGIESTPGGGGTTVFLRIPLARPGS